MKDNKIVKELRNDMREITKLMVYVEETCEDTEETFDSKAVSKFCKKMAKFLKKCRKMGLSDAEIYRIADSEFSKYYTCYEKK